MSLIEQLAQIYNNATKKEVVEKNNDKVVMSQVRGIVTKLMKKAEKGELEIRLVADTVFPEAVDFFIKSGFIVWQNSMVVVIKIPLKHNY